MIPDTGCTVTFGGDHGGTYDIGCEYVTNIDNSMVNTGNTTIYLYPHNSPKTDETYPYIRIEPGHYPRYYNGSSYGSYTYITNANNVSFNIIGQYYREKVFIEPFMTCLIAFCLLVRLFK